MTSRARIVELRNAGKTYGQIALALRISRNVVAGALRREREGVALRKAPRYALRSDEVRALRRSGHKLEQIALRLEVPLHAVKRALYG